MCGQNLTLFSPLLSSPFYEHSPSDSSLLRILILITCSILKLFLVVLNDIGSCVYIDLMLSMSGSRCSRLTEPVSWYMQDLSGSVSYSCPFWVLWSHAVMQKESVLSRHIYQLLDSEIRESLKHAGWWWKRSLEIREANNRMCQISYTLWNGKSYIMDHSVWGGTGCVGRSRASEQRPLLC